MMNGTISSKRRLSVAALVLTAATLMLGACHTAAGLGQDVSATGNAVSNSADKVKQGL